MAENNSSSPLKTAEGAAPPSNLPNWEECQLLVSNSEFIAKRIAEGGYGAEHDSKLATELHRFIHEYDDADSYRSAWFRHRLGKLLHEVAAQAVAAQAPAAVAVPDGWKLVPIEPQPEQLDSAIATDRDGTPASYKTLYIAMVGAALTPPIFAAQQREGQ